MIGINHVVFYGRLAFDPEVRQFNGGAVCKIGVISDRQYKAADGDYKTESCMARVSVWGPQGGVCASKLRKGHRVIVTGRLENDDWTDKDGNRRSQMAIRAIDVRLIDGMETTNDGKPVCADDVPF